MHQTGQIYRPPSEASVQRLEVTIGCSHNKCSFCTMYRKTPFRVAPLEDVEMDLKELHDRGEKITRIYLTNGDPFVLGTDRLVKIAELVHQYLPEVEVLTCYASIQNLKAKSLEDLKLLKSVGYDVDHTIFSFIPNTAEIAYYGMMQGLEAWLDRQKSEEICARNGQLSSAQIREILSRQIRTEKLAIKDIKLRTFIAEGNSRNDLAAHVYDTTYGTVREGVDSIVVIDDSIVRGTTLRQSIIKILCRQKPKKIVIVSSSPQIRYPDCYGIDMSKMGEFIAFHAAIALLKERGLERVIDEVYTKSKAQIALPKEKVVNYVKEIYAPFTDEEISAKIAEMITPENCPSEIAVVYQTIDHLHQACPNHSGDWYFSGDYPTPGGNRLVNGAFVEWYEKRFNS